MNAHLETIVLLTHGEGFRLTGALQPPEFRIINRRAIEFDPFLRGKSIRLLSSTEKPAIQSAEVLARRFQVEFEQTAALTIGNPALWGDTLSLLKTCKAECLFLVVSEELGWFLWRLINVAHFSNRLSLSGRADWLSPLGQSRFTAGTTWIIDCVEQKAIFAGQLS